MKKKIVLIGLFILPIVTYLIFASAKHNSLFLPFLSKANKELPSNWKTLNSSEKIQLKNKITVLGFLGSNVELSKGNLFNLNQKIYKKYFGFKDLQLVMVVSQGQESAVRSVIEELKPITEDMSGWKFVFAPEDEIKPYFDSYKLIGGLDEKLSTPSVLILDKEINHRGRKGKDLKGEEEYKDSYNTISAAELHNEMTDDMKIVLREYRLALKKNKRKDDFRDNITKNVEEKVKEK
ncbi:hypothetical protein [Flavobacterium sp. N2270]|uniref:hypothetical protein n=1 Tax=Flavobacterium sp. N2270 TaxID=2986831 RepID=UPI002225246F|nr:hypothetical protein [Flavobacterium sp. N2270]